jgi:hypothetical protein
MSCTSAPSETTVLFYRFRRRSNKRNCTSSYCLLRRYELRDLIHAEYRHQSGVFLPILTVLRFISAMFAFHPTICFVEEKPSIPCAANRALYVVLFHRVTSVIYIP